MYRTSIDFHKRLMRGSTPISYIVIFTHMGYRAYAEKELSAVFDLLGYIADGSITADGSELAGAGSAGILSKSGKVIRYQNFERRIQTANDTVMGSYNSKTLQTFGVELDNADGELSKLISLEPFIGRELKYYVGFVDLSQSEHIQLFNGIITEMNVLDVMTIEAQEQ